MIYLNWLLILPFLLGVKALNCGISQPGKLWQDPAGPGSPTKNSQMIREAELIAFEGMPNSLLPNRALVNKIALDVQAIRSSYPIVGNITHRRKWAPGALRLQSVSLEKLARLNESEFGPIKIRQLSPRYRGVDKALNITYVYFSRTYHPFALSEKLQELFGIDSEPIQSIFQDGDDISYTSMSDSNSNLNPNLEFDSVLAVPGGSFYTFVRGSGKCFIKCEFKHFWHFIVQCNKNRNVILVKEYSLQYKVNYPTLQQLLMPQQHHPSQKIS